MCDSPAARAMLISEFGKDPVLRDQFRSKFRVYGRVSTMPTDRGKVKIDQYHIYYVSGGLSMILAQ